MKHTLELHFVALPMVAARASQAAKQVVIFADHSGVVFDGAGANDQCCITRQKTGIKGRLLHRLKVALPCWLALIIAAPLRADTFGSGGNQFSIDFVTVGNHGNGWDTNTPVAPHAYFGAGHGFGSAKYSYRMGVYEVSQEMIDKATAQGMANVVAGAWTGTQPAANISWYEAAAFVNWLNTNQGYHAAYDLTYNGAWSMSRWPVSERAETGVDSGTNPYRHVDAFYFLPSEDEWVKAAYHRNDGVTSNYWVYPTASNGIPDGVDFLDDPSYEAVFKDPFDQGAPNPVTQAGSRASSYGTYGQGGNVWEWMETVYFNANFDPTAPRTWRGGEWGGLELHMRITVRNYNLPTFEGSHHGFRVASVYVHPVGMPELHLIQPNPAQAGISWSPQTPGFALQESAALSSASWQSSPSGKTNPTVVPATGPAKFYRLSKPPWFPLIIANPTPSQDDFFGARVAAVGNDRMLVGAPGDNRGAQNAGAAHLFDISGTLLTTFTNPVPAVNSYFGWSVAAVGNHSVLISASRVYLFSTNGALVTTFTNPTSAGLGSSVAVGSGHVLIGASGDDTGATDAGAAYLFSTNGTLLTTFTNPAPADYDFFGSSVAAVGNDYVLIGARGDSTGAPYAGAAYLFSTNGTLLTTFTNPTPADYDYFGTSVAAVGSDHVLIGASGDSTGGPFPGAGYGAAYLFRTNGVLLTTFTNPVPEFDARLGDSVAAVGSDQVLIGAPSFLSIIPGAAYLFSTNGTLLNTFTNPAPVNYAHFGVSVAAVGSNRVIIGAGQDDTGAIQAGAAFLFDLDAFIP